jgi:hypothetical protein
VGFEVDGAISTKEQRNSKELAPSYPKKLI